MDTLYNKILALCKERGIKGGKMCTDIGMSKGILTDLKMGRQSSISTANAKKIADYFGVSVDYLLGNEKKETPLVNGNQERSFSDDDIKFALWGDCKDISDDDLDDVRRYAAFVRERKKDRK